MPTCLVGDDEEYFRFILSLFNCAHQKLRCSPPCFKQRVFLLLLLIFCTKIKRNSQTELLFSRILQCKKASCWLCNFFPFGTEKGGVSRDRERTPFMISGLKNVLCFYFLSVVLDDLLRTRVYVFICCQFISPCERLQLICTTIYNLLDSMNEKF